MVSVQRRLNSTGRKRITRDRVAIELAPPLDAFSFPSATALIDLADLELDPGARVALEAYFRSSSQRFGCGTVGALSPPGKMVLSDVDRGGAIQFRLLVISADGSGRILASAEGLRPRRTSESPEREPLLPLRETDIGEELWLVDVDARTGPWLVINSRVPGLAARLHSDPLVQGLILPHALREVLRNLPSEGSDEDDGDWGEAWRKFLDELGISEPEDVSEDGGLAAWVDGAVQEFSRVRRFAELLRGSSIEGEARHV